MTAATTLISGLQVLNWSDDYAGLIGIAVILGLIIAIFIRQGRNKVLEEILTLRDFGPPGKFRGRLIVEDYRPGDYLKLVRHTGKVGWLELLSRWNMRMLRSSPLDEVTFDGSTHFVVLRKNDNSTSIAFNDVTAIRMREIPLGRSVTSLWVVELIRKRGKPIAIADSPGGGREVAFEYTAPLVKAISAITGLPMQAYVAGNVWTPGWPPKAPTVSS
jgi:hypothetical protein